MAPPAGFVELVQLWLLGRVARLPPSFRELQKRTRRAEDLTQPLFQMRLPYGRTVYRAASLHHNDDSTPPVDHSPSYLKDTRSLVRKVIGSPSARLMSCWMTSATRRSRRLCRAVLMADVAASSHDSVLVPMI